jgi:hypothetical protein
VVNRVQVFGDVVFTEDWEWDEISQVYDRLSQAKDINLDTTTKAHHRGEAVIREADLEGLNGTILVPMIPMKKRCRILPAGGLGVPPRLKNPPRLGD